MSNKNQMHVVTGKNAPIPQNLLETVQAGFKYYMESPEFITDRDKAYELSKPIFDYYQLGCGEIMRYEPRPKGYSAYVYNPNGIIEVDDQSEVFVPTYEVSSSINFTSQEMINDLTQDYLVNKIKDSMTKILTINEDRCIQLTNWALKRCDGDDMNSAIRKTTKAMQKRGIKPQYMVIPHRSLSTKYFSYKPWECFHLETKLPVRFSNSIHKQSALIIGVPEEYKENELSFLGVILCRTNFNVLPDQSTPNVLKLEAYGDFGYALLNTDMACYANW